jgi:hypothetical protein
VCCCCCCCCFLHRWICLLSIVPVPTAVQLYSCTAVRVRFCDYASSSARSRAMFSQLLARSRDSYCRNYVPVRTYVPVPVVLVRLAASSCMLLRSSIRQQVTTVYRTAVATAEYSQPHLVLQLYRKAVRYGSTKHGPFIMNPLRILTFNKIKGREPIYLIDLSRANLPPPRANFPRRSCDACQFTSSYRTECQFTSFESVAEPVYLLPEAPSQFTSLARRLSVVAGVLSGMLLSGFCQ